MQRGIPGGQISTLGESAQSLPASQDSLLQALNFTFSAIEAAPDSTLVTSRPHTLLLIDPMSRPVAIAEIIVLLILCALVGWLLASWLTYQRSKRLQADLHSIRKELDECLQKKEPSKLTEQT
ncbi:hypothetical protein [Dyadobacter sp. 22481]|uniref:hypothetical protein n=1 Tax=Dyadobacter sp. 22481 TaxID=3453926 RepID=UPI003F84065F